MYSLAPGRVSTSAELWARLVAHQAIGSAVSTLEEAGAALVELVDDADWQSEGFRALHDLLGRLRDETGAELGRLTVREWELGGHG
ncbi:hypothetical protein [Microbacterium paraoxydans]|uniref:hypothetical protein n=1 Tax=Microbacterium paraoxydans TaxID=199592 RepID=UPI001CFAC06D|nr:hypothetical protein [Microbacterium paraoxydans]